MGWLYFSCELNAEAISPNNWGMTTMTEKPWSKHYKPGVPHEIDADAHSSIWAMSAAAIEKFGDAAA